MRIRAAQPEDLPTLQDIERAAGEMFRAIGMPEIADDDPPPLADLERHQQEGTAWVATTETNETVAYLIADHIDAGLHIDQVSVHPNHGGKGIGRQLIDHAAAAASTNEITALTLTTFRDVPWNASYYERCGFRTLDDYELTPDLTAIRNREADHGLDRWPRVTMRRQMIS
ncbi:GNAT family N-acetyltransferase [Asanoa iriomotensis]|uniref:GCN5 family N-acetyltransferase n=1 Tax=Asanoa iriomotensis TaxID=234613 RepID=A0ABQ4C0F3_9ACTN|nr:GCN5 family N-acetyltransferase [Asanoa iriomotensis]